MKIIQFKPDKRLLLLSALLTVFGLIISILAELQFLWFPVLIVCFLVLLIDLFRVSRTPAPQIKRTLSSVLSLGVTHEVLLQVKNNSLSTLNVDVFDHFVEHSEVTGMPRCLRLTANEFADLSYQLKPLQRGEMEFFHCECLVQSPFGFWRYRHLLDVESSSRVYPNYAPVIEYALLATENHLSMMGIMKHRRRGQGMDFHQLREFREGDSMKQIDWKASSRMRKMIAREYQDERDQQIIVMMDCGHRMLAQDGQLSHFDHSLNALLLMSYVALRQGDSVGMSAFSHEERRWVKPVKGVANINVLLNHVYDLQPGVAAPDYSSGARDLLLRQRKRSLVLILTNLRDDDYDDLRSAVLLLQQYHKVVVASLQEQAMVDRLDQPVYDLEDALTVSSVHGYMAKRDLLVKQLNNSGITTLDVLPENLPLALTNTYLDLKTSGQI